MNLDFQRYLRKLQANYENHEKGFYNTIPFIDTPTLNDMVPGILQGQKYLMSALLGVGKSKWLRGQVIPSVLKFKKEHSDIPVVFNFVSLEEGEDKLWSGLVSKRLAQKNLGHFISHRKLSSIGANHKMDVNTLQVIAAEAQWYQKYYQDINFITISDIYQLEDFLKNQAYELGREDTNGRFVYDDPRTMIITAVDHIKLLTGGESIKDTIDKWSSDITIKLKRDYLMTFIDIQQQSLGKMQSPNVYEYEPGYEKLGEHKLSAQDADIFMGIFNPLLTGKNTYCNYNLNKVGPNFRTIVVIKNRWYYTRTRVHYILEPSKEKWVEVPLPGSLIELQSFFNTRYDIQYEPK